MKKNKKSIEKPPMKYWLVELTLTSGEVRSFYVRAIYQYEAYDKADYYASLVGNEKLFNMVSEFKLMP